VLRGVGALSVGGAAAITAAAVYEPGFRRELDFWWEGGAIIAKYVVVKLKYDFIFSDEEARSRRYEELHEENAPAALAAILELRGLYIKFGQVCSARDQNSSKVTWTTSCLSLVCVLTPHPGLQVCSVRPEFVPGDLLLPQCTPLLPPRPPRG